MKSPWEIVWDDIVDLFEPIIQWIEDLFVGYRCTISRIEDGNRNMSVSMIQKVLDALSVFPMLQEDK